MQQYLLYFIDSSDVVKDASVFSRADVLYSEVIETLSHKPHLFSFVERKFVFFYSLVL